MASENGYGPRAAPMYTISEAARLAGVSSPTVRRWLYGYAPDPRYPNWRKPPVFGEQPDKASPYVSFLQLIEIVVAADFRKVSHVALDVVTRAHANARRQFGIEYPFAHDDLDLESLGGHIVQWINEATPRARSIDTPEQFSLPGLVAERVQQFDYEDALAARWYPAGHTVPIVVDPMFAAGLPTIKDRGVTVEAIEQRWLTDEQSIDFIADDFGLEPALVERVLKYAKKLAA